jgi:hypothetical protein
VGQAALLWRQGFGIWIVVRASRQRALQPHCRHSSLAWAK